jgi:hypothetical protein
MRHCSRIFFFAANQKTTLGLAFYPVAMLYQSPTGW